MRAPKFHKGINNSDIAKIARKAAKAHREIIGKNPFKRVPDDDNFCIPIYHYSGYGLWILDNEIKQYCEENKEVLDSQIESVQEQARIMYLLNTDKGSKKVDTLKLQQIIAASYREEENLTKTMNMNVSDFVEKDVLDLLNEDIASEANDDTDFIPF